MSKSELKTIVLEQGWDFMQKGITKLKNILEGLPESRFSPEDYIMLYTTIYNMCRPPHDYSQQLYDKYRESIEEYITSMVLPSLREKHDEFMLRELVKRWANHKIMVRWLSRFFNYLDRYISARRPLPPLNEVGLTCFRDLVYKELNGKVRDAVISLIDQEREGQQIDRALLKNVLDIFVEIGTGQMDDYENDFEAAMLKDTSAYYSRKQKASNWILEDSCPDYMLKEGKLNDNLMASSKKFNLISSNGDVVEVDYAVVLMSKRIRDILESNPGNDADSINIPVSTEILGKVIEYCKKHTEALSCNFHLNHWDMEFINVDHETIFNLFLSSVCLNIPSLSRLSCGKAVEITKGKTPEEIRNLFHLSCSVQESSRNYKGKDSRGNSQSDPSCSKETDITKGNTPEEIL